MFPQFGRLPVALAATLFLAATASRLFGYALEGPSWPAGSTVNVRLAFTGPSSGHLQDGFNTFNASAADALALWNQQIDLAKFSWTTSSFGGGKGDGQNTAFFSSSVYGQTYGSAIAVTVYFYNGSTMHEADNLFNSALLWDSYRGPLQYNSKKQKYIYDFHRVALHEFGHSLGLAHPDDAGQTVTAIMNRHISDLDRLVEDDLTGIHFLYDLIIANASTGSNFTFQLAMANSPTSFDAGPLPAGLTLNKTSGLISGLPTISGVYDIPVTAFGSQRNFTFTLRITIVPPAPPPVGQLVKTFDYLVNRLAADPKRARIYATVPNSNSVLVFDTNSLSLIATVPVGPTPLGMALSVDGSKLWVANSTSTTSAITGIDLETLQPISTFAAPIAPLYIVEGLNGRLFATTQSSGIMEINSATGAYDGSLDYLVWFLALSLDRKVLYSADAGSSPSTILKIDVSTSNPSLLVSNGVGANGEDLKMSHQGEFLLYPNGAGNTNVGYLTTKISPVDLTNMPGGFSTGAYPGRIALSNDDSVAYQSVDGQRKIDVFNAQTFGLITSVSLDATPNHAFPDRANDIVVDRMGAYLFVATFDYSPSGDLRVYTTGRIDPPSGAPKSLMNVSTRMEVGTGDAVEIGGFILTGLEPKRIVVRAIAPTLSRYGVVGAMADPTLELHDSTGAVIASNDNWNSHRQSVLATGYAPSDEHEAAIVTTLAPGNYTAVLRGLNNTIGIALFELYDLDPQNSKIVNISTRGSVGTGENVMIAGFIVGGDQPTRVIVRGLGPTLTDFGVAGALADPTLELHDATGAIIAQNDDWKSIQEQAIQNSGFAPPQDAEAAILATLQPGNYTAIVRGKSNTTGVALVEVYNLDAN
jgi:YVTN family beta-propeller protein